MNLKVPYSIHSSHPISLKVCFNATSGLYESVSLGVVNFYINDIECVFCYQTVIFNEFPS
jgi:hypothetical protein